VQIPKFRLNSSGVRGFSIRYRPELDGIRGIAISGVLLNHIGVLPQGGWGVDLFFLLSGYLITTILLRKVNEKDPLRSFYLRRFSRLAPSRGIGRDAVINPETLLCIQDRNRLPVFEITSIPQMIS